jgi:hypothetical protein
MSAPEMTLDFIKALLWPAVVVIGLFWLFRSQVKTLFEKALLTSVLSDVYQIGGLLCASAGDEVAMDLAAQAAARPSQRGTGRSSSRLLSRRPGGFARRGRSRTLESSDGAELVRQQP